MKVIKNSADVDNVLNDDHHAIIRKDFEDLIAAVDDERAFPYDPEKEGWLVYFEKGDNLFEDNSEAVIHKENDGIYHTWGDISPGWEFVIQVDDLWIISMVVNNEFVMTYYLPDDVVDNINLHDELQKHCENTFTLERYINR